MQCFCKTCIIKAFEVSEKELGLWITNYNIENRQYIAENVAFTLDITDAQLERLFELGFEFVNYTLTPRKKLAVIVQVPDGHKGHSLDSWN